MVVVFLPLQTLTRRQIMRKYFFICFTALLLFFSVNAYATDTYNTANSYLSIDAVIINGIKYNNVVLQLLSANLISMGSYAPVTVSATCSDSNFTNAIFNAITAGMTKSQVTQTIGCNNDPALTVTYGNIMVTNSWMTITPSPKLIQVFFDGTDNIVTPNDGSFKTKVGF